MSPHERVAATERSLIRDPEVSRMSGREQNRGDGEPVDHLQNTTSDTVRTGLPVAASN
jgi:hypothetical protein